MNIQNVIQVKYNLNQINIFVRQNRKSTPIKSIDLTSLKRRSLYDLQNGLSLI